MNLNEAAARVAERFDSSATPGTAKAVDLGGIVAIVAILAELIQLCSSRGASSRELALRVKRRTFLASLTTRRVVRSRLGASLSDPRVFQLSAAIFDAGAELSVEQLAEVIESA